MPALHHAARTSQSAELLEQASYLFVGLLVWLAAFGGVRHQRALAGIAGLLLTTDAVVTEIREKKKEPAGAPGMDDMDY